MVPAAICNKLRGTTVSRKPNACSHRGSDFVLLPADQPGMYAQLDVGRKTNGFGESDKRDTMFLMDRSPFHEAPSGISTRSARLPIMLVMVLSLSWREDHRTASQPCRSHLPLLLNRQWRIIMRDWNPLVA